MCDFDLKTTSCPSSPTLYINSQPYYLSIHIIKMAHHLKAEKLSKAQRIAATCCCMCYGYGLCMWYVGITCAAHARVECTAFSPPKGPLCGGLRSQVKTGCLMNSLRSN